jgi:hypothetical protein
MRLCFFSCAPGTYLDGATKTCVSACPAGFYGSNSLFCTVCPPGCSACSSPTVCSACTANFFLDTDTATCVAASACPIRHFGDAVSRQCKPCRQNCAACSAADTCTSCVSGMYLNLKTSTCVTASACPVGTFPSPSLTCASCSGRTPFLDTKTGVCVAAAFCSHGSFGDSGMRPCHMRPYPHQQWRIIFIIHFRQTRQNPDRALYQKYFSLFPAKKNHVKSVCVYVSRPIFDACCPLI